MNLSLNEVEVTAKRATRGAGYSWGVAEEAGKAVRWLCSQGLDGCAALARLLGRFDGAAKDEMTPRIGPARWLAEGGVLCPLITGTALSDRAAMLDRHAIRTGPIAEPCLLFPFASYVSQDHGFPMKVEWPDGEAVLDGQCLSLSGQIDGFAEQICVRQGGVLGTTNQLSSRADPDRSVWEILNEFACRTYAPATEESRLKGAG